MALLQCTLLVRLKQAWAKSGFLCEHIVTYPKNVNAHNQALKYRVYYGYNKALKYLVLFSYV